MIELNCRECGTGDSVLTPSFTLLHEGKNIAHKAGVCVNCIAPNGGDRWFYCVDCRDIYKASPDWIAGGPTGNSFTVSQCPEHSTSDSESRTKCAACDTTIIPHVNSRNRRGQSFCDPCSGDLRRCNAKYCRAYIHPEQDDIELSDSNMRIYCGDCAEAKTFPIGAPPGYHPLSWDYRPECPCTACVYLAGRSDRWPESDWSSDAQCASCHDAVVMSSALQYDGGYYCHYCERREFGTCPNCDEKHHVSRINPVVHTDQSRCDSCMEGKPYWFCDVGCMLWWPEDADCDCGGVHPYNYSPSNLPFFWGESEDQDPSVTPLMGLELEVEAHKDDASRRGGAKLVREIAGDWTYVVHDGTLKGNKPDGTGGDHGFEVVTFPFTFQWMNENWGTLSNLMDTLVSRGYRSWEGGRCGLHIHISRAPMTESHQMRFIRFVYGSTNLCLCVGQRDYTDKNLKKFSPFDAEDRSQFIRKIQDYTNPRVQGHYAALNATKPATYEARWFRGTLNPRSVRKNLEFIHSIWHFTRIFSDASANEVSYFKWLDSPPQSSKYPTILDYIQRNYVERRD